MKMLYPYQFLQRTNPKYAIIVPNMWCYFLNRYIIELKKIKRVDKV